MKKIFGSIYCWLFMIGLILTYPVTIVAEEIKAFRLTGWEGEVFLRTFTDEQENENAGVVTTLDTRNINELEVKLRTNSYIYHPKFLNIDIGGGPVFVQNKLKSLLGEGNVDETLFNFNANLRFLEGKPYPFSFYLNVQNPLVASSINEHIIQENIKYGAKVSLREPLLPFLIEAESYRLTNSGDGTNLIVDDEINKNILRFYKSGDHGGYNQLLLQTNEQHSRSGSKSLVINPNEITTNSLNYDSRFIFGENEKYSLRNLLSYVDQEGVPTLQQLKFSPEFRWNHSKSLYSYYRYNYFKSDQQDIVTTNNSASAGYSNQKEKGISTTGDVHIENNSTTGFDLDSYGVSGTADYTYELGPGTLRLHAGIGYDDYSRETTSGTGRVQVFDEGFILPGVSSVEFNKSFIDESTIVVRNSNRTQLYILDIDYRVFTIGDRTLIQRLLAGSIQDGEDLLVDYEYLTGGTFAHNTLSQQYNANYVISKYMNIFAGINKKDISLTGGVATIRLNPSTNLFYGITADYPLSDILTVGGEIRLEDQDEDIAPYKRESLSAYAQFNLMRSTSLRLTGQKVKTDRENSLEDVDMTRYSLRLRSRPFKKTVVTFSATDEEDVGGTIPRATRDYILKGEWNFRRIFLSIYGRHNEETQGAFKSKRDIFRATLERRFW